MQRFRHIAALVVAVGILFFPPVANAKIYKVVRDSQGRAIGLKDPSDNLFKRAMRVATFPTLRKRLARTIGLNRHAGGRPLTQRDMEAPPTLVQQAFGLMGTTGDRLQQISITLTKPVGKWVKPSNWKQRLSSWKRNHSRSGPAN